MYRVAALFYCCGAQNQKRMLFFKSKWSQSYSTFTKWLKKDE